MRGRRVELAGFLIASPTYHLLASIEELHVTDGIIDVGSHEVGLQSLGWLVGHLDTVLQHRDREVG